MSVTVAKSRRPPMADLERGAGPFAGHTRYEVTCFNGYNRHMEIGVLEILSRWNRWGMVRLDPGRPRDLAVRLEAYLKTRDIVALVGPRRAGKTPRWPGPIRAYILL